MIEQLYYFDHNVLHICFWTLPAILVGVIMIIMGVVHNRNQKKSQEEFDKEMEPGSDTAAVQA